ncbi:MAG TPA: hypothetical protein VMW23_10370 [Sedimentisphaerales bacterium]|nr:hypothetical protein [Sedimentisphaerales bacterium]
MKPLNLIIVFILAVVVLLGCRDDTTESTSKPVEEEMIFNVLGLDHESMELAIQVGWLRGRFEKCLSELEKDVGLEPIPFDWIEKSGFPKTKRDPNHSEWYTSESQTFYVPYPTVKKPEINAGRYTDPKRLNAYIEMQLSARKTHMLGMDKYIKHLEERLKRLEERLNK